MGQDIELDFDSICSVDQSPNTVLPSIPRRSSIKKRNARRKHKNEALLLVKDDFTEIRFSRHHRSRKSDSPRTVGLQGNEVLKRGSLYQSCVEVCKIEDVDIQGERRKIEISHGYDMARSLSIVDSLCSSDEENSEKSPVLSLNTKLNGPPVNRPCIRPRSSVGFLEINLDSEHPKTKPKESSNHLESITGVLPLDNGSELLMRDKVKSLQKSFSAKVEMPQKHFPLQSDLSYGHSPKDRFSPFRKMLDPFMKSKSVRSPFSHTVENDGDRSVRTTDLSRNKTYRKSLLRDFSNMAKSSSCDAHFVNNDNHHSVVASSPVHLHGSLKLEKKHGATFFEFSQNFPEDVYVAKTWKTGNAFKSVYTFHNLDGRKKSNAGGFGLHNSCKNTLMVGQMQVSCYLSSELRDSGFENTMVTEFVLYETTRSKQSRAARENGDSIDDATKPPKSCNSSVIGEDFGLNDGITLEKVKPQQKYTSDNIDAYPWESENLHPYLESAAIVMQIPFSKRESLKCKRNNKASSIMNPVLQNLSMIEKKKDDLGDLTTQEVLKVVIPVGNHGLPAVEGHSPSTLLDRWRLGGGCDCGGWDMGCPLLILGTQCDESQTIKKKQSFELFLQGIKDNTPSLAMNIVKDGQYTIDFHAKLSTLQAFSICVAILHATEACTAVQVEEAKQLPHYNSLKMLLEDKILIDAAVTLEEKKRETRILKETPPTYVFNPPFSPIARV